LKEAIGITSGKKREVLEKNINFNFCGGQFEDRKNYNFGKFFEGNHRFPSMKGGE